MFISKNLLVFITTVQEGSLTSAAIKLFSTPPPMSRSIKILEDNLGFKLFSRTTAGLKLTDRGEAFYKDIYPTYARLIDLGTRYKKGKSGTINIGTHQLKSKYAGFLCNYFLDSDNYNIELQENTNDINQLDVVMSIKEIKGYDFDIKLMASCKAILLYASHLNTLPNKDEHLKKLPFIQSNIFSSSCCFKRFFDHLKLSGYSEKILHIDDQDIRNNLIEKGAGLSIAVNGLNTKNEIYNISSLYFDNDIDFDINYYIYFKSSVINKEFFINYVHENSPLSWREVNIDS
ncbi:LysR family transcriptional regulator [Yersinia enterocolitica]|uniref:LysR family transcriptional regulator n=1 Tax=Yersinia enterocolitica TaxID=630 RepID=UPI0005DC1055|nr:LysR family transcriptional regulator [Yersinia enterocolitica]CQQ88090.1 LysR family transcriptional regulator [Yersinia enterocolitica]